MTELFTPPTNPPSRLSVSALRDWNKCGFYFYLSRILKVPEDSTTHHRWAGSVLHAAFMLAYGTPQPATPGSWRTEWTVDNMGTLDDCMDLFEMLWEGRLILKGHETDLGYSRAQEAYTELAKDSQLAPIPARDFAYGATKALKDRNHDSRKAAYKGYFRDMLKGSLEEGLAYPVVALEQEGHYRFGGVDMLGFIDIVMLKPDGGLVYADLKSGSRCPSDTELAFDDQMNAYYTVPHDGRLPDEVWYHHMKSQTIMEVPKNIPLIEALDETVPLVMANIQEGRFVKNVSSDCARCNRRKSCMGL